MKIILIVGSSSIGGITITVVVIAFRTKNRILKMRRDEGISSGVQKGLVDLDLTV